MNVSLSWLSACTKEPLGSLEDIENKLAARGFPVEGVRDLAEGLREIVVGRVQEVRPHPDADRLSVCVVDGGSGTVQVVCGAPNVQAGGWYPFAPVGATLPNGMTIGKVKLRGQSSEGMLCSEVELGLGTDAEGLMVLDGPTEPGEPLLGALGLDDVRLDVEVTTNRSDLLSHVGVARELAVAGEASLVLPDVPGSEPAAVADLAVLESVVDEAAVVGEGVTIGIEDPDLCPRYLGLAMRGVSVGPSPRWLRTRLRAIGARPINNVVDATNYVLHELGHPLHAFDLDLLKDQRVRVRRARPGESIRTLDGIDRNLTEEMLTICDADAPIAVAGIMGGGDSEVTGGTTNVLLECALFSPKSIRSTRKALGMSTDASYRFERGVDPEGLRQAIVRTAEVILATAGGTVVGPLLDVCPTPFARARVPVRTHRVERVLGVPFATSRIRELLEPLGFGFDETGDEDISVEVPGFRSYDVTREVDLIEEIARTEGYDAFPETLPAFRPGTVPDHPLFELEGRVRDELGYLGVLEAQTPAFAGEGEGEVEIENPISLQENYLRRTLLPGLLRCLEHNLNRGNRDVRLFQLGTVFRNGQPGEPPVEETRVAVLLHGRREPGHWSGEDATLDLWDLKGVLEAVVGVVSAGAWSVDGSGDAPDELLDGPVLSVVDDGGIARGAGGRVRPDGADLPVWAGEVWGLEVALPDQPSESPPRSFRALPAQPGVDRDLALLVPTDVPVGRVLDLIQEVAGSYFVGTDVFDVYRGEGLPDGFRSVAVRVRFQAADRTLKDAEVDEAIRRTTGALQEELSVGLRGHQG